MKKVIFAALFFSTSLLFGEMDPRVKPEDDKIIKSEGYKAITSEDGKLVKAEDDKGITSEDDKLVKPEDDRAEDFSFTEEPMEEEVVEDEAFLELLKTALLPELHSLDTLPEEKPVELTRTPLSFVSEEEIDRPEVEAFRKLYLSPKWSALLKAYLESAMEYRLYVRKAVQDAELPEMLEYLPVVESNYKTSAKSRSGARSLDSQTPF